MVKPSRRKEMAIRAKAQFDTSIRLVCEVFAISETCYRYQAKLSTDNAIIADWLLRLTATHKRWGFGLCYYYHIEDMTAVLKQLGKPTSRRSARNVSGLRL